MAAREDSRAMEDGDPATTAPSWAEKPLESYGAPALHVYALNRWELPLALAREIGR